MARSPRQIGDQADVLDERAVTLHQPDRPSWQCPRCTAAWPCRLLRGHLLATMSLQDVALYMSAYARDAERELTGEVAPMTVYERMFGWVGEAPRQHPMLRRPPGGPW